MSKSTFFVFPSKAGLDKSQLLRSLWNSQEISAVNATTTLPLAIKSKSQINLDVEQANPDASSFLLKTKQSIAYAKLLLNFYKTGVKNVWNNKTEYNNLVNEYKIAKQVTRRGKDIDTKLPGFTKLTSEMAKVLYISQVESNTKNNQVEGDVIKNDSVPQNIDPELFNLSRSDYQLIRRTPGDFVKIPAFGLIFMVFMEMTPIICYAFPEITPSTCVLPSVLLRLWNPAPGKQLRTKNRELGADEIALKTAYNLPIDDVRLLARALRLTSKYVPSFFYPDTYLRRRLQDHHNYLKVDNYYLSGFNGNGNLWNLSNQELLLAGLERNLIEDLKRDINSLDSLSEDEKTVALSKYFNELRVKLFRYLIDYNTYNIGYLTIPQPNDPTSSETIIEWRKTANE